MYCSMNILIFTHDCRFQFYCVFSKKKLSSVFINLTYMLLSSLHTKFRFDSPCQWIHISIFVLFKVMGIVLLYFANNGIIL